MEPHVKHGLLYLQFLWKARGVRGWKPDLAYLFSATVAQERGLQAAESWKLRRRVNYLAPLRTQTVLQPEGRAPGPRLLATRGDEDELRHACRSTIASAEVLWER